MSQATELMNAVKDGNPQAAEKLFPLVYEELRQLAGHWLAREKPGQTLQPTALVHEAYLRLIGTSEPQRFDSVGHFFAAAAEAMRRILVDYARRRNALKRGGDRQRKPLDSDLIQGPSDAKPINDLLALDDALNKLAAEDPSKAELVKLRYFAGLTLAQAAQAMGISPATADRWWAYAKAFLYQKINSRQAD